MWFVAILLAIGTSLALYRGFTNWENTALNFAGALAVLVTLAPMDINCKTDCGASFRGTSAILLFACLAFASVFCAQATLDYLPPDAGLRAKFRRRCKFLGALMLFSPLVGLMLTLLTNDRSRFTFIAEAFGMWCFAAC